MSVSTSVPPDARVDVRGPRFAAWITTGVLVTVLVLASFSVPAAASLLGLQATVFALGAALGPRRSPYGALFAHVIAPRLAGSSDTEPVAPLRFAQLVGFAFAAVGTIAFAFGAGTFGSVATGFALSAALLNAAFGFCLGCRIYPLVARMRHAAA